MEIIFYITNKRVNSTALPTSGDSRAVYQGELKEGCNVLSPVVTIAALSPAALNRYNYAYIADFGRYYWVSNVGYSGGIWEFSLTVDPLASYRTEIGAQSCYVTRAYSAWDGTIVDGEYPVTADRAAYYNAAVVNNPFSIGGDDAGTFVLGVVNDAGGSGPVTYYAFSFTNFGLFLHELLQSPNWLNISSIEDTLQSALVNPTQYFVSCIHLDIPYGSVAGTAVSTIRVGWWSFTGSAKTVSWSSSYQGSQALAIPHHPQQDRGTYLNLSPYTEYHLDFMPFGSFTIDSASLQGWNTLDLYYSVALSTGDAILLVSAAGRDNTIRIAKSNLAVQIPIAQIIMDFSAARSAATMAGAQTVVGALAAKGGYFANVRDSVTGWIRGETSFSDVWNSLRGGQGRVGGGSGLGGSMQAAASNAISAATAGMAHPDIQGSQGSAVDLYAKIALVAKCVYIADEDREHRGRPLCQIRRIDTLSGYVQVQDADISIACLDIEREAIQRFMIGGFYYE